MKKVLLLILLLLVAFGTYWFFFKTKSHDSGPKQQPLALKKHSTAFNKSVSDCLDMYFAMKDALVEADTVSVKINCKKFIQLLDSIPLEELKNDTANIYETAKQNYTDIKSNAESLLQQTDILEMRKDFGMVSEMMYPSFFKTINYEGPNLYWQNCPMAYGEGQEANWISKTIEIINPYMGKHHPEYKAGMLHCGELKDTIKGQ
jgi:hypothetical protein